MNCFLGIDIGTSAIKCILISEYGQVFGQKIKSNTYLYKESNKIEFNADDQYKHLCSLIRSVLRKKPTYAEVKAICITGASGNALLLDQQKEPLTNAVSWMDNRAEQYYHHIFSSFSAKYIHSICGWPLTGSFPLSYFHWMQKNEPTIYYSTRYYVTDFIYYNYRLSNSWVIDTSTATNFYLQDQVKMQYHQPILDFLNIKEENLPKIVRCATIIGHITPQAALETNLPKGTAVVAGSFDHPSAARGAGMIEEGDLLMSCGTSWVGFFPIFSRETALRENLLIDPFLSNEGLWGAMFSFSAVGSIIGNYIDLLFKNSTNKFREFEKAVLAFNAAKNKKFHFDLLQKEIPREKYLEIILEYYDVSSTCESIIENMLTLVGQQLLYLQSKGINFKRISMVGGFSESDVWTQRMSNVFNMPISIIQGQFAGCYGAAILAGMGMGIFDDELDGYQKLKIQTKIITPNH
jgi:sugar (pentulose or hexulose) kinase